jgi:integral membrane protein
MPGGHKGFGMTTFFRLSGALEALSYLVLLFVAMPLKYLWHRPEFVRWTGSFHGAFFLLFCVAVGLMARQRKWTAPTTALAFASAFVPFGPLLFERRYL